MPILSEVKQITNDLWNISISIQPNSLSQADSQLISKFGEPTINTGGTFETGGLVFTLPGNYIRVVSDLPYNQSFDSSTAPFNQGFANTVSQTNSWLTAF